MAASLALTATTATAGTLTENFDVGIVPTGWSGVNNSAPLGSTGWSRGVPPPTGPFNAHEGANDAYITANFNNTTGGTGTISNWLITPLQSDLTSGDAWSFYTRVPGVGTIYPDRLEVRLSTNGSCSPGTGPGSVGDFTTVLQEINPTLTTTGYPFSWTRFSGTLAPMAPASGCFAFRYHVTSAGPSASFSDYIGIDTIALSDEPDDVIPETTIGSGPTGAVASSNATFGFSGTPAPGIKGYECRLVGASPATFADCPGPTKSYTGLADGDYSFEVRAVSHGDNLDPTPATRQFTVDTTPPDTQLSSGPSGTVASADATFTYAGTPTAEVARFECRIDDAVFATCPDAGTSFSGLSDGAHRFEVRAVDAVGNADPTPAGRDFTVDTTAPDTEITSGPSGTTDDTTPTFAYAGAPTADVDRFECRVDDAAFAACADGETTLAELADGEHRFEVRAVDAVGNADPTPAGRDFTVDTTAPDTEITSGPEGPIARDEATFGHRGTPADEVDHLECRVDDAAFAACADDETTLTELADGDHRFEVRAVDAVGNADPTPAGRDFTVDTTAPETEIAAGPSGTIVVRDAAFAYAGTPTADVEGFECRLVGSPNAETFASCPAGGRSFAGLADGSYRFEVRAVDAVGNADPTPAVRELVVAVPPVESTRPAPAPPVADRGPAPKLEGLALSWTRLAPSGDGSTVTAVPRVAAGERRASSVTLRLSAPATLTFVVQRVDEGRTVGGRCRIGRSSGTGRACVEYRSLDGAFTRRAAAGDYRAMFRARLNGRALPIGRYRLTVYATDAAGQRSPTSRVGFRVVP